MSCNDTVQFVIATLLPTADTIEEPPTVGRFVPHEFLKMRKGLRAAENMSAGFLAHNQRFLPSSRLTIFPATNGFNHTQVLDHLLQSGLAFHSLSKAGKKWGKIATYDAPALPFALARPALTPLSPSRSFLTKYRALQRQIALGIPYQLLFEDDVLLEPARFWPHIAEMCAVLEAKPSIDILQLSGYSEALLLSLAGARRVTEKIRQYGIMRNDDQQLLHGDIMKLVVEKRPKSHAWRLGRPTNAASGHIFKSRKITWAEVAMLRLISDPKARSLPSFGSDRVTDYMHD